MRKCQLKPVPGHAVLRAASCVMGGCRTFGLLSVAVAESGIVWSAESVYARQRHWRRGLEFENVCLQHLCFVASSCGIASTALSLVLQGMIRGIRLASDCPFLPHHWHGICLELF